VSGSDRTGVRCGVLGLLRLGHRLGSLLVGGD
jgi:hypothetical protein